MPRRTRILGLTGSIGMGKSTAAAMVTRLGVPVFNADHCVHDLLAPGGKAVAAVTRAFPGVRDGDGISRPRLAGAVFGDISALVRLEDILHPMVRAEEHAFIRRMQLRRVPVAALEIPLLFETGADGLCDLVVVLHAPRFVQEARVLARPGMTRAALDAVRARQMPEAEKLHRADIVVRTGLGRRHTLQALTAVVRMMKH